MTPEDLDWYRKFMQRRTMRLNFSDQMSLIEMYSRLFEPHKGEITFRLLVRIQKNLDELYNKKING
jgi:hypothetical protein